MHETSGILLRMAGVLAACLLIAELMGMPASGGSYDNLKPNPGSVELTNQRTEFSKTFSNPDGTRTWVAATSDQPMHYRDAGGSWQEIDPTIRPTSTVPGYRYAVIRNTFHAYFADKLSSGVLARFQVGDAWVCYSVAGDFQPSSPKVDGRIITYPGVFPGADIRYTIREGMAKQEIILHHYSGRSEFRFRLETRGLTPKLAKDGSIRFYGEDGSQKWHMPKPMMWDSSDRDEVSCTIEARLEKSGGTTVLIVKADENWLTDPTRIYPVYLDPTWGGTAQISTADTWISSKSPNNNMHDTATNTGKMFRVGGGDAASAYGIVRALVKFDLTGAPAQADVMDAPDSCRVYAYCNSGDVTPTPIELHKATTAWSETTTWNQFNNGFDPTVLTTATTGAINTYWTWGYNASSAGHALPTADGFLLKAVTENLLVYKELRSRTAAAGIRPYIEIDYGLPGPPPAPAGLVNTTDTVTFTGGSSSWSAVGSATSYDVALGTTAGGEELGIFNQTATTKSWTGLTPSGIYFVKVRGRNAMGEGAWSAPVPMTMGLIVESHSTGYQNGTYSEAGLLFAGDKSLAPGVIATSTRAVVNTGPGSTARATFSPAVVTPGYYEVFVTWPKANVANTLNVRYTINHAGGSTVLYKDQTKATGDAWWSLGFFYFNAGSGSVVMDNSETTTNDGTSKFFSDAVKLAYIPGVPAPANVHNTTDYTTFTGGATAWDPVPSADSYDVALGTTPGGEDIFAPTNTTSASFSWSSLTAGTTYYAKVRTRLGSEVSNWSNPVPMTMGIIIECRNGYESGWYSETGGVYPESIKDAAVKSAAPGLVGYVTRFQNNGGPGSDFKATFAPVFGMSGNYRVYVTWPAANGVVNTPNAKYTINHAGGSTVIRFHEKSADADRWVYLGTYTFNAGSGQSLTAENSETTLVNSPPDLWSRFYVDSVMFLPGNEQLTERWSYITGGPVESSPTVDNGIAYCGSNDGSLYAVNISNGSLAWSTVIGAAIKSRVALYEANLYFTAADGKVYSVTATGTINWSRSIGGAGLKSTPAVSGSRVYVGSDNGTLYKLDAVTGDVIASQVLGSSITASPTIPPVAGGGMVIVGTDGGTVYGVHTTDSAFSVLWSQNVGSSAKGSPMADWLYGVAYVGSDVGVTKLVISNGSPAWTAATSGEVKVSPWVTAETVYAVTADAKLYAFDASGALVPGFPLAAGSGAFNGAPVVVLGIAGGAYLYAASESGFYTTLVSDPAVKLFAVAGSFNSSPSVSGTSPVDVVVVGCSDGRIRAFQVR